MVPNPLPPLDPCCFGYLTDRKYFRIGSIFMKRTLRPHEQRRAPPPHLPPDPPKESHVRRWTNEGAALTFLARVAPSVPVPRFLGAYHDDGAFCFMSEWVDGVSMAELPPPDKKIVMRELRRHLATLRSLRSKILGGLSFGGFICPPYRVLSDGWAPCHSAWSPRPISPSCFPPTFPGALASSTRAERALETAAPYVFVHNDLGQHNVLVDPRSLKITAILDWEYAGFWPVWFDRDFWKRPGPSVALAGEVDDTEFLRRWLVERCYETPVGTMRERLYKYT
ncbi:MAG: hypothetical protein M1832_004128 [Thelocarpon impressellum]|nr:MAG: hypothetical protein M1832_004128 [Thelocarpon impressellum]